MENNFKFYNTLTRQIDTVVPRVDGKIGMYTCGPTVYHYAHIGNLRSYIMEDVLEKECLLRCKENLASHCIPEHFYFLPDIPLTPMGKIDYRTLEAMAAAGEKE